MEAINTDPDIYPIIDTGKKAETEPKLCINCKHVGTNSSGEWAKYKCFAPQNFAGINLVAGHKEYGILYCIDARVQNIDCGAIGSWYESKPAPVTIVPAAYSVEVLAPAQLADRVRAAKAAKQRSNSGSNLLEELGL